MPDSENTAAVPGLPRSSVAPNPRRSKAADRPLPGTILVWQYLMLVWRRSAVSTVVVGVATPLLYLLAMGFGLGTLVNAGPGAAELGGVTYVQYIAPALVVAAALQTGVSEAAYPVYSRFKWTRVFWGISATPVRPSELAGGQLLFIASRLLLGSGLYYLVTLAFGVGGGVTGVLMVPTAVLTGVSCAVWVMVLAAVMKREGTAFNIVFRFVVIPMTLFSGSFFPISELPPPVRVLAWFSPLWHGNELARAAAFDDWHWVADVGHLSFLLALALVGWLRARRSFTARLIV
jgi:lipooligosaccharide transport system permease protein